MPSSLYCHCHYHCHCRHYCHCHYHYYYSCQRYCHYSDINLLVLLVILYPQVLHEFLVHPKCKMSLSLVSNAAKLFCFLIYLAFDPLFRKKTFFQFSQTRQGRKITMIPPLSQTTSILPFSSGAVPPTCKLIESG